MWILTSKKTGTIYYLLPEKQNHTVGRTNTDLILKDDNSISRSHACLYPAKDHVKVVDIGSKYGTFYNENIENNSAMEKNKQIELKNGERIQFGIFGNEWTISKLNICTLTSSLNNEEKIELKKIMDALDGNITETWIDSCTHLTMSEITVTLKALKALVENIPIVSCNYWKAYLKNLQDGKLPPNCNEYLPKLAETFLNKEIVSFGLNDKRKTIFQGKIFIFMNKKLSDKYESIIKCAGGECKDLNQGVSKTFLTKKNVIVVQHITSSQQLSESQLSLQSLKIIDMVTECIASKGRRLIPDFEIGLAIIYCSTEKYCNPDYDKKSELLPNSSNMNIGNINILAQETPFFKENTKNSNPTNSIEIPESGICDDYEVEQQIYKCNTNESESLKEIEVLNAMENRITEDSDKLNEKTENIKRKRSLLDDDDANNEREVIENLDMNHGKSQPKKIRITTVFTADRTSQVYNLNNFVEVNRTNYNSENIPSVDDLKSASQQINQRKRGKIAVIRDNDDNEENSDDENDLFNFGFSSAKKQKKSTNTLEKEDDLFDFPGNKNKNKNLSSSTPSTSGNSLKEKQIPTSSTSVRSHIKADYMNKKPFVVDTKAFITRSINKMNIEDNDNDNDESDVKDNKKLVNSEECYEVKVTTKQLVPRSFQDRNSSASVNLNNTKKNFKAFVKKQNYKPQNKTVPTVPIAVKISC